MGKSVHGWSGLPALSTLLCQSSEECSLHNWTMQAPRLRSQPDFNFNSGSNQWIISPNLYILLIPLAIALKELNLRIFI